MNMEYINDLDQAAMDAFGELSNDSIHDSLHTPAQSPDLAVLLKTSPMLRPTPPPSVERASCSIEYLFKFDSVVTPDVLAAAAILSTQPKIVSGSGSNGLAQFCNVPSSDMRKLKDWLSKAYPTFRPTFAPINKARMELSPFSAYPTLGLDTTLPQHRPQSTECAEFALEDWPGWYFFYGTLADPEFLAKLLHPGDDWVPKLFPASISGGKIRMWGGKYKALVDAPGEKVEGWAYHVWSHAEEDALRMYETAKYEVVRVEMDINGMQGVKGCTFRFAGDERELD